MENMKCIEENDINFFATGGSRMELGLDLSYFPHVKGKGINLSSKDQTLQQSYQKAKQVFERVKPDTIKFVLIDLSTCLIHVDADAVDLATTLGNYFKLCFENGARPVGVLLPVRQKFSKTFNAEALKIFRDTVSRVGKDYNLVFIDLFDVALSIKCFSDKTHLNPKGAKAVSILLSVRLYRQGILSPKDIYTADNDFFNVFAKYFPLDPYFPNDDKPLIHRVFCSMVYRDFKRLSKIMSKENRMNLMVRVFYELTYSYLANLADILPKDDYNELTTRIFNMTVENIRRKDKIRVGFYFEFSSHWCGDDLYNLFAQDERFEPTIFVPVDYRNEFNRDESLSDLEKFKARGLNVLAMKKSSLDIPKQDILFRLRPYPEYIPPAFKLTNIKVKETLLVNIPYSFTVVVDYRSTANYPLFNVLWKKFFPSTVLLERHKEVNKVGMPRGVYSGYPKLDVFFKHDSKFHFGWKMVRPDAKKIIWAPHWSIGKRGVRQATFHWNYQFMYEFAKAHPEISWVVKPHPLLFRSTLALKLFSSPEALREYFQKWDDLPNAQVYTGTYYNDVFATSDGMIHDCCSFTAEYQYVNKPMIFLTRERSFKLDELGEEILKASYLVNGKDLNAIATLIQRVFIEGDDYKATERKAVFDKYLNYLKNNGMLASEFIYKNIVDELKLPPR